MKFKPHHSIALLVAAMPLVATLGASAQEAKINFLCNSSLDTVLLQTQNGSNYCPSGGGDAGRNNPFYSWSQQGFTVLNNNNTTTGTVYNQNQGDTGPGGARQGPTNGVGTTPSTSALGSGASISLTVTDGTSLFEFNQVDLASTGGAISYTITGLDGASTEFTLICGGGGSEPVCPTGGPDYTTIKPATFSAAGSYTTTSPSTFSAANSNFSTIPITKLTIVETPDSADYAYLDQLYVTNVPEGGTGLLYVLLAGGACFGAMFLVPRNRYAKLATA
jgi:hypothetical protein